MRTPQGARPLQSRREFTGTQAQLPRAECLSFADSGGFEAQSCSCGLFLVCMTAGWGVIDVSSSTDWGEVWAPQDLDNDPTCSD